MQELEKNELMEIQGGKWWFVALGLQLVESLLC